LPRVNCQAASAVAKVKVADVSLIDVMINEKQMQKVRR
jgi:hypothetical protein